MTLLRLICFLLIYFENILQNFYINVIFQLDKYNQKYYNYNRQKIGLSFSKEAINKI